MRAKAIIVCAFLLTSAISMGAATYKTLYNFDDQYGIGGYAPFAGLTVGQDGNLYGVAAYGSGDYGEGTVFKLTPTAGGYWTYKTLHQFHDFEPAGGEPVGGLAMDDAGNIYGTNGSSNNRSECGTIFASSAGWGPIYTFTGGLDGCMPLANLHYSNGMLLGTTSGGGAGGQGTVFFFDISLGAIFPYSFQRSAGTNPLGGFNDWHYGTAFSGGRKGEGSVYNLDVNQKALISKHTFKLTGHAGYAPMGDLLMMEVGSVRTMYGTTSAGSKYGDGAIYQLTQEGQSGDWQARTLHWFSGPDGKSPMAGLTADSAGNLYGTTSQGGDWDCGTVFKLSPKPNSNKWKYTVLYSFNPYNEDSGGDGCYPTSSVVLDSAGNLYGTTAWGGWSDTGTVYEIIP